MDTPKGTANRKGAVLTTENGNISASKLVTVLIRLAGKCNDLELLELLEEVDLDRLDYLEEGHD